jgi:hypothetical protein
VSCDVKIAASLEGIVSSPHLGVSLLDLQRRQEVRLRLRSPFKSRLLPERKLIVNKSKHRHVWLVTTLGPGQSPGGWNQ